MLTEVSRQVRFGAVRLAKAAILIYGIGHLPTGCVSKPKSAIPVVAAEIPETKRTPDSTILPLDIVPATAQLPTHPSAKPSASIEKDSGILGHLASSFGSDYDLTTRGPNSIRIAKRTKSPQPARSLFEESILLGKIRATLKSGTAASNAPAPKSTFKDGTATISFPAGFQPDSAAPVIAKCLSIEGVETVQVVFPNP